MREPFRYESNIPRIIFGFGAISNAAEELRQLGCSRALVLSTPHQENDARSLAKALGSLAVGVFSRAAMHTPVDVTTEALSLFKEIGADCVLSLGGGSTIGLGKAIAYRNDTPQLVIATTYAGSEVTPILGQTENGVKTTVRGSSILPETVIYDPELTIDLPVKMSVTSGLNAMAHAVEGLYARDRNPIASMMAMEGIAALQRALPAIVESPRDRTARADALYGSWLCGVVLGAVGMALHHKLCHTLGGSFDLPHAETHAILLPHTIAYTEQAVPELLAPVAQLFGASGAGTGLYDFALRIGAPMRLRDLGVTGEDLDKVAALSVRNPYWNPRPLEVGAIRALLQNAWEGVRPG
ncbi:MULTISPECIES: maleylacetate reductase [Rhizobium]|uniref:maleylacetate reductase n=1 Tax=Rhizobium TaxID=379 RepID=UPI00235FB88E|nr:MULTISPECIES: maleylacetate reductase [unclassified Rhizobium]MDC9809795.1 maleylacetate reductase [Rhizobium sp. MC62]WEA26681.1 maleylacetate reductase [Rhizobium sp. MJ22]WEA61182.1 maleylacetate reductase [Rhizobium sp. BJ04]